MLFSGWAAIYDLSAKSRGVARRDSIIDLVAAYLGVSQLLAGVEGEGRCPQPTVAAGPEKPT